jgi:hypothetical protein
MSRASPIFWRRKTIQAVSGWFARYTDTLILLDGCAIKFAVSSGVAHCPGSHSTADQVRVNADAGCICTNGLRSMRFRPLLRRFLTSIFMTVRREIA